MKRSDRDRKIKGWRRCGLRASACLLAAIGLFVSAGMVPPAWADGHIGVAENVVGDVYGETLNARLRTGDDLRYGQKVRTGRESAAALTFQDDTELLLGERAEIVIDDYVYDPKSGAVNWTMQSLRGVLRFVSGPARTDLTIKTPYANVGIRGTAFYLKAGARETEIAVSEGLVEVRGLGAAGTSVMVGAGEVYAVGADGRGAVRTAMSADMQTAIQGMLGLLNRMDEAGAKPAGEDTQLALARRPAWQEALEQSGAGPGLTLETTKGLIVIEALEDIAPAHVARMARLADAGFYDGLPFYSVKPGFAVEVGPPADAEDGSGTGAAVPLPAELTGAVVERGTVGMVHPKGDVNGATSRFFIALAPQPQLEGKYTVWGRVIYGMDVLDTLKPGDPPADPDTIVKLRIVSE